MSPNVLERLRATDSALKAKDSPAKPRPEGDGGSDFAKPTQRADWYRVGTVG